MTLLDDEVNGSNFTYIEDLSKLVINSLQVLSVSIQNHINNSDALKFLNKSLTLLIFLIV